LLATDKVASVFIPGTHASTFGGNPLAMAAGVATVETFFQDGILENCSKMGSYFFQKLKALQNDHPLIQDVRGKGLIIGVEISMEGSDIVNRCLDRGLLINCTCGNVLRFVPPLIVAEGDIDRAVEILDTVLREVEKS
jgi:acetylornithine/N-succinyldiaminopimelate aminotransferase